MSASLWSSMGMSSSGLIFFSSLPSMTVSLENLQNSIEIINVVRDKNEQERYFYSKK